MDHRQEKIESLLAQQVGLFLSQESGKMSLITVTRVEFNQRNKHALVYLSVLPENQEKTALEFAKRKSPELREWIEDKISIGSIPFFEFMIDIGEKNRQRVEEISAQDGLTKPQ
jgi:ribosome-binding factor A